MTEHDVPPLPQNEDLRYRLSRGIRSILHGRDEMPPSALRGADNQQLVASLDPVSFEDEVAESTDAAENAIRKRRRASIADARRREGIKSGAKTVLGLAIIAGVALYVSNLPAEVQRAQKANAIEVAKNSHVDDFQGYLDGCYFIRGQDYLLGAVKMKQDNGRLGSDDSAKQVYMTYYLPGLKNFLSDVTSSTGPEKVVQMLNDMPKINPDFAKRSATSIAACQSAMNDYRAFIANGGFPQGGATFEAFLAGRGYSADSLKALKAFSASLGVTLGQ